MLSNAVPEKRSLLTAGQFIESTDLEDILISVFFLVCVEVITWAYSLDPDMTEPDSHQAESKSSKWPKL